MFKEKSQSFSCWIIFKNVGRVGACIVPSKTCFLLYTDPQIVTGPALALLFKTPVPCLWLNWCLLSAVFPTWSSAVTCLFLVSVIKTRARFKKAPIPRRPCIQHLTAINWRVVVLWLGGCWLTSEERVSSTQQALLCLLGQHPESQIANEIFGIKTMSF